jgi:hypothetical protein
MPDDPGKSEDALAKEREMREHEREVRERDPNEVDAETARREGDVPDDAGGVTPAPPPNVQHGSVSQ